MFPGGKRTQRIAMKRYGSLPTRAAIDSWQLLFHIATLSAPLSFHRYGQNDVRAHVAL